jgi:hypothetical protein
VQACLAQHMVKLLTGFMDLHISPPLSGNRFIPCG